LDDIENFDPFTFTFTFLIDESMSINALVDNCALNMLHFIETQAKTRF